MVRKATWALLIASIGAWAGCKDDAAPSGTPPASASAASTTASNAAALGPVDACLAVMEREIASPELTGKGGRISRGCAPLYKEPACREAHEKFDDAEIKERAVLLATKCADAYCPKLADPKPKLCTMKMADIKPTELGYAWFDMRTAIWKIDLGEAEAKRLERETLRLGAQQR